MFARRSAIFAVFGGFVAGTLMFGDTKLAYKRARSTWFYHMQDKLHDPKNNEAMYHVKING